MIRKLGWLDRGMWVLQIIGAEQESRSDGRSGCWLCCLASAVSQEVDFCSPLKSGANYPRK